MEEEKRREREKEDKKKHEEERRHKRYLSGIQYFLNVPETNLKFTLHISNQSCEVCGKQHYFTGSVFFLLVLALPDFPVLLKELHTD